jgi:hypothetical protein
MTKPFIDFKKQRDFGLLLTDTFGFIRNEFKPFLKTILTISAPVLVLFLIAMAFYTYTAGDLLDLDGYFSGNGFIGLVNPFIIIISAFAYLISALLAYIFTASSALHYIKSYIENNGDVNVAEVKQTVYNTFWGYLGLGVLKWMTLLFALVLCVFPVLYAMVPMFIVFSIFIFEANRGATDTFGYSFYLVNQDFWLSLGTMIVLGILMYVLSFVFAIPTLIYTYAKMGVFSGEFDPANMESIADPIYILLNLFSTFFQLLLNLILVVASALLYFHLNEKKNFTGAFERISTIGKTEG